MPTWTLLGIRMAPWKDIGISPYEMLHGLPYLSQSSGLPSFETKDQFLWNYVLGLSSALSSLRLQGLLIQTPSLDFQCILTRRLHPDPELEWRETRAILGGTLSGVTHCLGSSMYCWEGMDPLCQNKMSSQGETMDHVLKSWQHKSNLKRDYNRAVIPFPSRKLSDYHQYHSDLFSYSYWIWCMHCNTCGDLENRRYM
jgi:hypothetical protein